MTCPGNNGRTQAVMSAHNVPTLRTIKLVDTAASDHDMGDYSLALTQVGQARAAAAQAQAVIEQDKAGSLHLSPPKLRREVSHQGYVHDQCDY